MRKILISLILASAVATPAFAAPSDWRDQARADRQQAREERQQSRADARPERAPDAERPQYVQPQRQAPQVREQAVERPQYVRPERQAREQMVERPQYSGPDRRPPMDGNAMRAQRGDGFAAQRSERIEQVQQRLEQRQARPRMVGNPFAQGRVDPQDRLQQMRDARDLRQSTRPLPPVMRRPTPVVSDTPRPGTQPPLRADAGRVSAPQWSTNWRHNDKYDWYNYRRHHHSLFQLGFYYDPFGWGYSPYQIGWRLWPSYYSSRYWLTDPWQYRLPYAPPGTRWVRYWDDAVLVDTWTGEVVDVIYDFFW